MVRKPHAGWRRQPSGLRPQRDGGLLATSTSNTSRPARARAKASATARIRLARAALHAANRYNHTPMLVQSISHAMQLLSRCPGRVERTSLWPRSRTSPAAGPHRGLTPGMRRREALMSPGGLTRPQSAHERETTVLRVRAEAAEAGRDAAIADWSAGSLWRIRGGAGARRHVMPRVIAFQN